MLTSGLECLNTTERLHNFTLHKLNDYYFYIENLIKVVKAQYLFKIIE